MQSNSQRSLHWYLNWRTIIICHSVPVPLVCPFGMDKWRQQQRGHLEFQSEKYLYALNLWLKRSSLKMSLIDGKSGDTCLNFKGSTAFLFKPQITPKILIKFYFPSFLTLIQEANFVVEMKHKKHLPHSARFLVQGGGLWMFWGWLKLGFFPWRS